jgi:uncharacterized protein
MVSTISKALDEELWGAVKENDLGKAKEAITKGANVNYLIERKETLLYSATCIAREEMVEILLKNGANPNLRGKSGDPLSVACAVGNLRICELLIEHGANIEAVDETIGTPLLIAVDCQHPSIVRLLVNKGANIYAKDKAGNTPISVSRAHEGGDAREIKEFFDYILKEKLIKKMDDKLKKVEDIEI